MGLIFSNFINKYELVWQICKKLAIVLFLGDTYTEPDAGWSSLAARRAHNPKVTGSNPVPATILNIAIKLVQVVPDL